MYADVVTGSISCPSGDKLITAPVLSVGSTDTQVATTAFRYMIGGKIYDKAAVAAGTAVTATTVPATKFGAFGFEIGANGTIDKLDAPDNATGYASAGDAISALMDQDISDDHVLIGYVVVEAPGGGWTGATDDLVAGSDCTNAYFSSVQATYGEDINLGFVPARIKFRNRNRNIEAAWNIEMEDDSADVSRLSAGLLSKPRASIGSTDTRCANGEFWYEVNGVKYYKAAVEAGTAPSATTVPQTKWGLFGYEIGADGTIDKKDAAGNVSGYATEAAAIAAFPAASAGHVLFMYFTVLAPTGGWVGATDDLVVGSDCDAVNFYDMDVSNPITSYGVTPLDGGESDGVMGVRLAYNDEFFYPGDTIEYEAER